jgi:hypothetical protein
MFHPSKPKPDNSPLLIPTWFSSTAEGSLTDGATPTGLRISEANMSLAQPASSVVPRS